MVKIVGMVMFYAMGLHFLMVQYAIDFIHYDVMVGKGE